MKILVTGGAGYIGSTTCSALIDAGHTPIILDSFVTGCREFVKDRIVYEGDISEESVLCKIFIDHPEIEYCIHFAARIIIPESVENPYLYYMENVSKSITLFELLHKQNIKGVIFSSSASLYESPDNVIVTEQSSLAPCSPYARTKFCMEMALEDFCNAGYFKGIALRYFNPIGADPKMRTGPFISEPSHILGKLMSVAKGTEKSFKIMGTDWGTRDGTGLRDYVHVWDLARAHVLAVERFENAFSKGQEFNAINLGSGKGVTVKEFVHAFNCVLGHEVAVEESGRRAGDVAGACASCERARELLGWETEMSVEQGILDALAWGRR